VTIPERKKESSPSYVARFDPERVWSLKQVQDNITTQQAQLVDARSPGRFEGREDEPRPGILSGSIPGSLNVCWTDLYDKQTPREGESGGVVALLKNKENLREVFEKAGVQLQGTIVTSCGSGVTAACLVLALTVLGHNETSIYDGSWLEWVSLVQR